VWSSGCTINACKSLSSWILRGFTQQDSWPSTSAGFLSTREDSEEFIQVAKGGCTLPNEGQVVARANLFVLESNDKTELPRLANLISHCLLSSLGSRAPSRLHVGYISPRTDEMSSPLVGPGLKTSHSRTEWWSMGNQYHCLTLGVLPSPHPHLIEQ
jgi:hypothetical protein